jgi:hypothetical protein
MKEQGNVYVNATITFKGSVNATLTEMSIAEWIHDIIHCGDYEFEVVRGDLEIEDVEQIEE